MLLFIFHQAHHSLSFFFFFCRTAIRKKELPPEDRLGLEGDAFALAKSGYIATSSALALSLAFENEDDFAVWADLSSGLGAVQRLFKADKAITAKLDMLMRRLYTPIATSLGWKKRPDDSDLTVRLRSIVLGRLINAGDEAMRTEAIRRFEESLEDPKTLSSDLWNLVYTAAAKYGDPERHWKRLYDVYRTASLQEQRIAALTGLGAVPDAANARKFLDWAIESGEVRSQDFFYAVAPVGARQPEVTWQLLQDRWEWLNKTFGTGQFLFGRIISMSINEFNTYERLHELEAFFKAHDTAAAKMAIAQALETIRTQAAWLTRSRDDVAQWLEANI
jgi:aminopeptidase N